MATKKKTPRAKKKAAARAKGAQRGKTANIGSSLHLAAKPADVKVRRIGEVYVVKATELETVDGGNGRPGLGSNPGYNALAGKDGAQGHSELKIVANFDRIAAMLNRLLKEQLHGALKAL